jgi:hypothetical protein
VLAASIRPRKPGRYIYLSYDWVWSEWTFLCNTPNLQDVETISIRRVYEVPSLSITGLQLTHSFAVMLMMTKSDVDVEVAASLSFLGSSWNTADDKAVGDLSIHWQSLEHNKKANQLNLSH